MKVSVKDQVLYSKLFTALNTFCITVSDDREHLLLLSELLSEEIHHILFVKSKFAV